MIKRFIDIVFSFILLVLLSPAMGLIFAAIRLTSRGEAIFKQQRVGFRGRAFTLYKFRTMYCFVDPMAISPSKLGDKRITAVGRFLRKYALDEWPQFFNILKGNMSFVGPRPQLQKELEELKENYAGLLEKRLQVRPGLTSSWAITKDKIKIKPTLDMLKVDCRYVDETSLWLDIKILFHTFTYLLGGR
ncbi:MAG: sugar transferase [bacterium]|nr:sugar transferase [bacterium]